MIRYPAALLLCLMLSAMSNSQPVYLKTIMPHTLAVTDAQTTHVIFPCAIRSVDRGSADVLVQKVKDAEHILQVKTATKAFAQTNLSVVTIDGRFYSFALHYEARPSVLSVLTGHICIHIHAPTPTMAASIASKNLPIWGLYSTRDELVPEQWGIDFFNWIDASNPVYASKTKFTLWTDANHVQTWARAFNPLYTSGGYNIYQWMLLHHR